MTELLFFPACSDEETSLLASVSTITTSSGSYNSTWTADVTDLDQWLQLEFSSDVTVVRIVTSGAEDGYVTNYHVAYSSDGSEWSYVRNSDSRFASTYPD